MSLIRSVMIGLTALLPSAAAYGEEAEVRTWIKVEQGAAGQQHFVAYMNAAAPFAGRYELVGEKRGAGGTSVVRQGGMAVAVPGQDTRLSQVTFGGTGADTISVRLKIYQGDKLVSQVAMPS